MNNFNLKFNENCDSPGILVEDFFESNGELIIDPNPSEGITITKVTISFYKNICTDGCTSAPIAKQVVLEEFLASELPAEWTFENNTLLIPYTGGIAKVVIKVDYTEGEVEKSTTTGKCAFVPCNIVCCIIDELFSKEPNYELVEVIQSIKIAIECGKCCLACDLYMYIIDKLKKRKCKPCN